MCLGWYTGLHCANAPRFNNNHKVNLKNILSHSKRLKQKYKHTYGILVIIMIHTRTHTTEHIKLCVYRLPYGRMKDVLVLAPSNIFLLEHDHVMCHACKHRPSDVFYGPPICPVDSEVRTDVLGIHVMRQQTGCNTDQYSNTYLYTRR